MRRFIALKLLLLLGLTLLSVNPVSASDDGVGVKFSSELEVYDMKPLAFIGSVNLSKIINSTKGELVAIFSLEARLVNKTMGLNFTVKLDGVMSLKRIPEGFTQRANFTITYVDYGLLARFASSKHVILKAQGSSSATITQRTLNTTLKTSITPSTGDRMKDALIAQLLAYMLNETLANLKEWLEKIPNTTVKYKVTLAQNGYTILLDLNVSSSIKLKTNISQLTIPKGLFKVKVNAIIELNVTKFRLEIEAIKVNRSELVGSIGKTFSVIGGNVTSLNKMLDNMNTLLESMNSLITTFNKTLASVTLTPITPQREPEVTKVGENATKTTPPQMVAEVVTATRQYERSGVTLALIAMVTIMAVVLVITYTLLTRKGKL